MTMCYMYEANSSDYDFNAISVAKQRIKVRMQLCHITSLSPRYERDYVLYKMLCSM